MFFSNFQRKKALKFNIVYFANFAISASLLLEPPSNKRYTFQKLIRLLKEKWEFIAHINMNINSAINLLVI